jgi:4-amino-4-deoxy-L-arabinose transferase-like glycosyltransferase
MLPRQQKLPISAFDQPFYLGIAQDLIDSGRFTNGFMFDKVAPGAVRPPGMRFAPVYSAMLAAAARLDPGLRRGMACVVATNDQDTGCPSSAPLMRGVQFCELAGFFLLVWHMGRVVGGGLGMGWASLALALVASPLLLRSVTTLMTEMTCLVLTAAASAAGMAALRRGGLGWAALAGVLLGLTALTRPGFLYLLPAAALGGALAACWHRRGLLRVAAFLAAGLATIAPWILRNILMFGRPSLTFGYDSHTLVQRIAFDSMNWREYGLAYLCWLPDGTSLGRNWIGPGACDRFGWDDKPNSFYTLGLRHMLDQSLAAAGGYEHHMGYLLHNYLFRMPLWHLAVSVPLALRGAYVAHWWGFVLLVPALIWTWIAVRRGPAAFLMVALPAFFMLALNAAVAVNQVRYNLMLVPAYAIAGALCLRWAAAGWLRVGIRRRLRA